MEKETHSIYGASGAKRWRNCPGSVSVIETGKMFGDIPESSETVYSSEGTEAHSYAEKILKGEATIADIPNEEMAMHVEGYVKLCQKLSTTAHQKCEPLVDLPIEMVEGKVPLFYRPEDNGIIDYGIYDGGSIQILDLKYGVGVEVDAEDNDQQAIYCISFIKYVEEKLGHELGDDVRVALAIYQPRHHSFSGSPKVWETTVRDMKDYAIDIENDYEIAKGGEGKINPSKDACQFCDARGICAARINKNFANVPSAIDPLAEFDIEDLAECKKEASKLAKETKTVELLDPKQIAFICMNGSDMKKTIDNVMDMERKRLEQGGDIREVKLVEGKLGARTWVDEAAAQKMLVNKFGKAGAFQPSKLLTASQAVAKLEGEEMSARFLNKFNNTYEQKRNKPSMVPTTDKREAIVFTKPEDELDDEEAESML